MTTKKTLSIVLIGYNNLKLLKTCFESLRQQTYPNLEIIFIDNNSQDESVEFTQKNFSEIKVIVNKENLGYSGAANQGIELAKGEYLMILNPDIILEPQYIEICIEKMEEDLKIGVIGGKIYKFDFENHQKTQYMDTVGLFCYKNRRIIDNGQGLLDEGQFEQSKEVFGFSGACPIYRREALEDVKVPVEKADKIKFEYLDNDFFMYKEDVDISWRMRLFGWKCWYEATAVAHHGRGTGVLKRFTHFEVAKNRRKLNPMTKYWSYKNQRLMQLKNEFLPSILKNIFPILWKEILAFGYIIFLEPKVLKSWVDMWKLVPKMLKKRKYIMAHRRIDWREMEKWLDGKQSEYLKK